MSRLEKAAQRMSWTIKHRDTEKYVTMDILFGLDGAYEYTSDKLAAAKFASREEADNAADALGLINIYITEMTI